MPRPAREACRVPAPRAPTRSMPRARVPRAACRASPEARPRPAPLILDALREAGWRDGHRRADTILAVLRRVGAELATILLDRAHRRAARFDDAVAVLEDEAALLAGPAVAGLVAVHRMLLSARRRARGVAPIRAPTAVVVAAAHLAVAGDGARAPVAGERGVLGIVRRARDESDEERKSDGRRKAQHGTKRTTHEPLARVEARRTS